MHPSPISLLKSVNLQVRLFQFVQRHGAHGVIGYSLQKLSEASSLLSLRNLYVHLHNNDSDYWRDTFEALLLPFDAGLICLPWQLVRRTESQLIESRYEIQFASLQPKSTVDACISHIFACCSMRSQIQIHFRWLVLPSQNAEIESFCHHSLLKLHVVHVLATKKTQLDDIGSNLANLQSLAGATNFAFVKGDVLWLGWFWKSIEVIEMFWTSGQSDLLSECTDFTCPVLYFVSSCCVSCMHLKILP